MEIKKPTLDEVSPDWVTLIGSAFPNASPALTALTFYRGFQSASGAVEVGASDNNRYVIKGLRIDSVIGQMIFNDHIAALLGKLIGAPVPQVTLIDVPQALIDLEPKMKHLRPGLAHASASIPDVSERINDINHVDQPENKVRFAALAVFCGWLMANDRQFLYQLSTPFLVYSVDHGHYFPAGPNWTTATLDAAPPADFANDLCLACKLVEADLQASLSALKGISASTLADILKRPPEAWGVDGAARVALAKYLWKRRERLVERSKAS